MGTTAARPRADADDEEDPWDGVETLGYRVLGVQPDSPASQAGLVSFLDFLVGANGKRLLGSGEGLEDGEEYDDIDFPALLFAHKGRPVELLVWNIKAQEQRFVDLIPDDTWGGAGLLGVTIKLDSYESADERLIRVLEVEHPNSPAATAGLVPLEDFLLGTTATVFGSTQVLASVLEQHVDKVLEVYVYNSSSDMVRVVAIVPTTNWEGGEGLLGAQVGTGFLHRLPHKVRTTPGQSVERKIRWLQSDESEEGGHLATATQSQEQQTMLAMEPHLEMETSPNEDGPEAGTRQPHELGMGLPPPRRLLESDSMSTVDMAPSSSASEAMVSPNMVPVAEASAPPESAVMSSPAAPSNSSSTPLPPPPISSSSPAQELFAAPPPDQPEAANPFGGMPTPPKMHY